MKTINTKKLLKEVAKEYGKTPEEIRAGIEEAINAAWNNPDQEVHLEGNEPTRRVSICGGGAIVSIRTGGN